MLLSEPRMQGLHAGLKGNRGTRPFEMAGLCLAVCTTVSAKAQLQQAMSGNGVRLMDAHFTIEVVLERLSTILLRLTVKDDIRRDSFAS